MFRIACKLFITLTILTGAIYPLFITFVVQVAMKEKADGSLLYKDNKIIGSSLIGQNMAAPRYFWPRPSAIQYNPLAPSGGSNLAPSSLELKKNVEMQKQKWGEGAPSDLLYSSGSGLDPHISLKAALFQSKRVAKERGLEEEQIQKIIYDVAEKRALGFLRPSYVNVLLLNLALDNVPVSE